MSPEDSEPWKTNRERRREPKFGRFWCDSCDRAVVDAGAKCGECGARDSEPRRNKPGAR